MGLCILLPVSFVHAQQNFVCFISQNNVLHHLYGAAWHYLDNLDGLT
jgi:hypothetical protein